MSNSVVRSLPVAVIIPVYNRPQSCLRAVESVYSQTALPAEVIVVDDGSTESHESVQALLLSNQGQYLCQQNRGVSLARNLGAERATQPYLAFLDSDDSWCPTKLEKQFELHRRDPTLVLSQTAERWLLSGAEVKQRQNQAPAQGECFARCLELCCISASAVIIRRDVFLGEGGFDPDLPVCEDYDLWLRLTRSYPVGLVSEPLVIKNRGGKDHLSESLPALDRFRVRALVKLLERDLSPAQSLEVRKVLTKKLGVLEQGAKKRGLLSELDLYHQIRAQYHLKCSIAENNC